MKTYTVTTATKIKAAPKAHGAGAVQDHGQDRRAGTATSASTYTFVASATDPTIASITPDVGPLPG